MSASAGPQHEMYALTQAVEPSSACACAHERTHACSRVSACLCDVRARAARVHETRLGAPCPRAQSRASACLCVLAQGNRALAATTGNN
eukprot:3631457-Pleurochrysis_carterae.AAC.2